MNLEEKLKQLPQESGVYKYYDKHGHLLYVGKAKNLKNRVRSYFKFSPHFLIATKVSIRIHKMLSQVHTCDWIITSNENDALILENSLIKQLKPKYNILLRDDKTYPYIYINYNEDFPRLEITRKVYKNKNIKYFGPYSIGARDMLDSIYEIVPLVQKKSCLKEKKACLFYQIKRCYAPCEGKITSEEYRELIKEALSYIYNKTKLIARLNKKMNEYSDDFRFEDAMKLRDRIKTIKKSQIKSAVDLATNENIDIFAIKSNAKKAVLVYMFIRDGKLTSSSHNFIKVHSTEDNLNIDLNEAYERAIINYYDKDIPILPKEILLDIDLENKEEIENFLYIKFKKKIKLVFPKKDKKKYLIDVALNNCEELLRIDLAQNKIAIYEELKELLHLETYPFRIETYDNSHMMGQATVGAMVVWDENINSFKKDAFRHYNLEAKDEYAQMKEVLTRRVQSFEKNPAPDMWIIDGGLTLLKLAYDITSSFGIHLNIIAIAKEKINAKANRSKGSAKDIIHFKNKSDNFEVLNLSPSDKRLQFIQKQRDEAHRFVISYHRKQKRTEDKQISLLQIKGIGQAKVKKLLLYFGAFELIKSSSIEELKAVLNEKDSTLVYEHFNK